MQQLAPRSDERLSSSPYAPLWARSWPLAQVPFCHQTWHSAPCTLRCQHGCSSRAHAHALARTLTLSRSNPLLLLIAAARSPSCTRVCRAVCPPLPPALAQPTASPASESVPRAATRWHDQGLLRNEARTPQAALIQKRTQAPMGLTGGAQHRCLAVHKSLLRSSKHPQKPAPLCHLCPEPVCLGPCNFCTAQPCYQHHCGQRLLPEPHAEVAQPFQAPTASSPPGHAPCVRAAHVAPTPPTPLWSSHSCEATATLKTPLVGRSQRAASSPPHRPGVGVRDAVPTLQNA